jgi:chromosome segregation ATPase
MQSLQTSPVKDLRNYLENRTPERSPERPNSRHSWMPASRMNSIEDISPTPHRATTPTPLDRSSDTLKETPTLRPTTRQRSIYGENTPPSATMLALQTMQVPEPPLNDITNGYAPTTPGAPRVNTNYDFSSQLLNLTSIATSLQKEMHQLSRRSKDNATDLLTLKEATNSRDEDIRKSLRELADTVSMTQGLLPPSGLGGSGRSTSGYSQYLDNRPFSSPPSAGKTFSLPRAASAHSFLDEPRCPGSPSPYSVEGAASVAMLEKIIREMVTKDGQDRLLTTLSEMLEKGSQENKDAKQKVEELAQFIRERSESSALVTVSTDGGSPKLELNLDSPKVHEGGGSSNDEELLRLLQRIKDSVTHSGGTTAEVKGLVRDLRGEVLGMGRELGKKMDQLGEAQLNSSLDKSIHEGKDMEHLEEVQRIVEEGLTELKQTLSSMVKERTEQDDDTFRQLAVARPGPNSDEMLAVIQHALSEHSRTTEKSPEDDPGLDRDGVLDAVKEGLKDFEPNIELQQFGLERDEILAVLKEGLEEYRNERSEPVTAQIDKAEIYEVLQEALQNFEAPYPAEQIDRLREELIANVRQALEDFKPPPVEPPVSQEAMQAAVFEAVKEGLERHGGSGPRELEISRDDLFDAVKASLDASALPFGDFGEQVLSQLKELIEGMHVEFKQYSAANGRDTEQVLDAIKDGLESLRCEIETYVDRAQDVTGKDEIVDTVKGGLEQLREDVKSFCAEGPSHDGGRAEMLEYIKAEFEQLHEAVASNASRNTDEQDASEKTAVVMVLKEGLDDLKSHLESRNEDLTSNEELNEAMKAEFEQLKGAILNANAADKTELTETIQDCLGALHAKLDGSDASASSNGATEEVIETMREELAALKESIHEMIGDNGQDAIAQSVREAIEELRTQIQSDQNNASIDALAAIKQELETFKDSISNAVVVAGSGESAAANDEALEAIRSTLDEIKETIGKPENEGISTEQLEAIRGEFENLRTTIASSVVHGGSNEEVMDAMRLGLDDLRSHLERKLDNPETVMQHQSQVLDALNEGLESLRTDIIKTLDKPLDQTVNYEILETLKDGLSDLRAEMNKLGGSKTPEPPQGGEIVLADPTLAGETRELSEDDAAAAAAAAAATAPEITKADFEKLEVLLAQLQIKIEAMDNTVQEMPTQQQPAPVPEGIALKDDLTSLEGLIRELQESVGALAEKPDVTSEGAARKEDTDAIETLLRNTKSHLEEMVLPDPATAATKEHLDEIQAVVSAANEAITGLSEKLESSTAAKADVAVVEVLANDIKTLMEEMKAASEAAKAEDVPEPITKEDVDVLGVLCTEIKTRVNEMVLPEVETLPTKADMEQLQGLLNDFRESHDKMRDSYETDIAVTAKAFDDRKKEYEETLAQIDQVKNVLGEVKTELLAKMADGDVGIDTLGVTLKAIEERSSSEDVMTEVKGVMEKLKEEFERAHSSIEAIKVDQASSADSTLEKQSEHKDAIIAGLGEKLDTAIATLISKYDDAQKVVEEKAKTMEEKTGQQEELLNTTKSMADDLKLSIDTLGMTLTSFMGDLPAQVEKMTEESKIVFTQAEATHTKLEETSEALKAENTATREEVARVLAAVDVVQSDMSEHNPRFMVTLEEVRALINQHYEHSQKASTAAEEQAQAVKELQDALKAGFEETKTTHADGLKSHHEALEKALPGLFPPPAELPPPVEKYDDAAVQEKLDKLMSHVEEANERSTQLERLDQIHEKVIATATEVSAFVAAQNKQIQEEHETKEKEAEEIALLLERRLERKDQLEADITVLNEEKESLQSAVEQLKAEKEALAAQKSRLNADVRAMETALHIRRDELHEMDNKAAMIERRMLEGVMNQSRMLLLSRSAKSPPSPTKKKPQGRDLRIPSTTSATSEQTTTSSMQPVKANHAFAMKARPGIGRNGQLPNTAERRIMSLNQITNNVPTGAHAFVDKPSPATGGLSNVKRSHSVKTNFMGKPSWAERKRLASLSSANKENQTLSEEDESMDDDTETPLEFGSDAGTERRTSYLSGEGSMSYATGSYLSGDGETPLSEDGATRRSYAPSDMTYGTGSYMTGSEADHRTSLGSASSDAGLGADRSSRHSLDSASDLSGLPRSELSTVLEQTEVSSVAPVQASGSEIEAAVREVMHDEMDPKDLSKLYAPPSDSGLGTDCPTAAESGGEGYFQ